MNKLLILMAMLALSACGQPNRENLNAFAKAYGYVKYFHPSDEASGTDWNRFAIYGA
jgi:hypothetical protein